MSVVKSLDSETIAAIATPRAAGALAVIRVSGNNAREIVGQCLAGGGKTSVSRFGAERKSCLRVVIDEEGRRIDECLVVWYGGPRSFTGEDVVELSCHGGLYGSRRVLERILENGARLARSGEFSERAYMNGKLDLTQAEAIMNIVSAKSDLSLRAANTQLAGGLSLEIAKCRKSLLHVLSHIEAFIDFPDEDIDTGTTADWISRLAEARHRLSSIIEKRESSRRLDEGVRIALVGPPNAGKSSLMNRLLGRDRSIVSAVPGTTRDTVEEVVDIRGVPVRFVDTAGVRETSDEVEVLGVDRSLRASREADFVILVFDGSTEMESVPELESERVIGRICNKSDLLRHPSWPELQGGWYPVSCVSGEGVRELLEEISSKLASGCGEQNFLVNARHHELLTQALTALEKAIGHIEAEERDGFAAADLRDVIFSLDQVVGGDLQEDLLDEVFRNFCLGK